MPSCQPYNKPFFIFLMSCDNKAIYFCVRESFINSNQWLTTNLTRYLILILHNLKSVDQLWRILNSLEISNICRLTNYEAQIGDAPYLPSNPKMGKPGT